MERRRVLSFSAAGTNAFTGVLRAMLAIGGILTVSGLAYAQPAGGPYYYYDGGVRAVDTSNPTSWTYANNWVKNVGGVFSAGFVPTNGDGVVERIFIEGINQAFTVGAPPFDYDPVVHLTSATPDFGTSVDGPFGMELDDGSSLSIHGAGNLTYTGGSGAIAGNSVRRNYATANSGFIIDVDLTTLNVYDGGTLFLGSSLSSVTAAVGGTPVGSLLVQLGAVGQEEAHFSVNAMNLASDANNPGQSGRGSLSLHLTGYDPDSSIHVRTGNLAIKPNSGDQPSQAVLNAYANNRLWVTLTASNNGPAGLTPFNTLFMDAAGSAVIIDVPGAYLGYYGANGATGGITTLAQPNLFLLDLDAGYTPTTGQVFTIVDADLATSGAFGNLAWDTDFLIGGYTFQIHNSYLGNNGVFLEVIAGVEEAAVVPEPSSIVLALAGMVGLCCHRRLRRALTR